ncbi:hypothetical protein J7W19_00370 [Streptomyces mobaraensis NBRC 13819 = DSM 40847]|uniref:Non-ribosomal peptide synthase n=2 Tax=Streptomyces TaxID=1883 RepID=M3C5J4_STRM1|nr:hypothetical protein [Streptomyces mobaraensis]AAG02367.1 peptide synthetase NRPS [Streptomyces verticillus]EME99235.1 non-ribosomal peptide synthase [Streptomyces mobaraensis NBRC 13819 = DSM 40847]QTT72090.1 hypothetical protein J7W19_00370 [Streptomyces mobaraensis NBRC 13819 = DSM 40847]
MTAPGTPLPATFVQRGLWPSTRHARPAEVTHVRALRLTGDTDTARLTEAVRRVTAALPALTAELSGDEEPRLTLRPDAPEVTPVDLRGAPSAGRDAVCVALLRADRDHPRAGRHRARFHLVRLHDDETVLALTAHTLLLDTPSLYAVLGAVCQAYAGRFRPEHYRDATTLPDAPHAPLSGRARASRRRWWHRRLAALPGPAPAPAGPPRDRVTETHRLRIPAARWKALTALTALGGPLGGNGSLAVMALAAWCLRAPDHRGPARFTTVVDLRDHLGLGPAVGPFTDRLVFGADLGEAPRPSFRDVTLRAQSGFLDAVVHYLPYGDVVELGRELGRVTAPRTAAHWDVALNFCRNPPTSAATRGERTLAERGLSIELFREADLLGAAGTGPAHRWDGTVLALSLGELGDDTVLVLDADRDHPHHGTADRLLHRMDEALLAAVADPDAPLPPLPAPAHTTRSHR